MALTVFNVKNYGAKGNGTNDDTTAIQSAITAAIAAGGGNIYFPQGIYSNTGLTINSTVPLFLSGDEVFVSNYFTFGNFSWLTNITGSVLKNTSATNDGILLLNTGSVNISNLGFIGNGNLSTSGFNFGNFKSSGSTFTNVVIVNYSSGLLLSNSFENTFNNLETDGCLVGVNSSNPLSNNHTFNNWNNNFCNKSAKITNGYNYYFYNGVSKNNDYCFSVEPVYPVSNIYISGFLFDQNRYANIQIDTTTNTLNNINIESSIFNDSMGVNFVGANNCSSFQIGPGVQAALTNLTIPTNVIFSKIISSNFSAITNNSLTTLINDPSLGNITPTVNISNNYDVQAKEFNILVDTSIFSITVNLPSNPSIGRILTIKDRDGYANTNHIIVNGNGKNIDGYATLAINTIYGSSTLLFNNNQWNIMSESGAIGGAAPTGPASGDLIGSYPNPTVAKIQGHSVTSQILNSSTDGYVLTWDNLDGYWKGLKIPTQTATGTAGGDLFGTYPNPTVSKINGSSLPAGGTLTTGNVLQVSGLSSLTYGPVNLSGGSNYVIGNLPITNIAPGTAGQIFVTNSTPASTWTSLINYETVHGRLTSGGGGSDYKTIIGPFVGSETSNAAIYLLPNATAPSATNPSMWSDGTSTVLNAVGAGGTIYFDNLVNTITFATLNVNALTFQSTPNIQWAAGISSPVISQATPLSDVAPQNLTLKAQAPFGGATINPNAGDVIVQVSASQGATPTKFGGLQIQYNSAVEATIGAYLFSGVNYGGALWLGNAPNAVNYNVWGSSAETRLNGPSGGAVNFMLNNAQVGSYNATSWTMGGTGTTSLNFVAGGTTFGTMTNSLWQFGTSVVQLIGPTLQWAAATVSPTINQQAPAGGTATGQNLTIAPQSGGATSGQPGSLVVNIAAPNGGSGEGFFTVQRAGINRASLGGHPGNVSYADLWLGPNVTPTNTNFVMTSDGISVVQVNTPSQLVFSIANAAPFPINITNASGVQLGLPSLNWIPGVVAPSISQQAPAGATSAGQNLTISPQSGGVTSGQPGALIANIAIPNGGSAENFFTVSRGGTAQLKFGPLTTLAGSYAAIYPGGVTPDGTNFVMYSALNGTNVGFNSAAGGVIGFDIGGSNYLQLTAGTFAVGTGTLLSLGGNITFQAAVAAPTINQAISTTGAGVNLTIAAQNAKAASSLAGGSLVLESGISDGTGFQGSIIVNPTSTFITAAGANSAQFAASVIQLYAPTVQWTAAAGAPILTQVQAAAGAGQNMLIAAQAAATGSNANGGNLQLEGGTHDGTGQDGYVILPRLAGLGFGYATISNNGAIGFATTVAAGGITPGTAGQIYITNATPASAWTSLIGVELTHGRFTSGGTGSDWKTVIGPLVGSETTTASVHFLPSATAASATNWSIAGDATTVYYNAPSGIHNFYNAGSLIAELAGTSLQLITPTQILWGSGITSPTITQTTTSAAAGQSMTIHAQATSFTNAAGGNLNLLYGKGNGTGDTNTPGNIIVNASDYSHLEFRFGGYTGNPTVFAGMYVLPHVTASTGSNFIFLSNGTNATYLNVPQAGGTIYFNSGNSLMAQLTANTFFALSVPQLQFTEGQASPTFYQAARTSDLTTSFLKMKAQDAWNNVAATHTTGGDIWLEPGASSTATGQPGNVHVYLPSNGSAFRGKFYVEDAANGAIFAAAVDATYGTHSIYLDTNAAAVNPSNANAALTGAGATTYLNATTSVGFQIGGSAVGTQVGSYTSTAMIWGNATTIATNTILATAAGYIALESGTTYLDQGTIHFRDALHNAVIDANIQQGGGATTFIAAPTVTALQWGIATQTNNVGTSDFTIYAQNSYISATGASRNGGNVHIRPGAGSDGTSTSTQGKLYVDGYSQSDTTSVSTHSAIVLTEGGNNVAWLGTYSSTFAALWLKPAASPTITTYSILGDGQSTYINASSNAGNIYVGFGGSYLGILNTTAWSWGTSYASPQYTFDISATAKFHFTTNATTARISHDDLTTASGTGATLTIQAQNETGTTSTGGDLVLTSGTGTTVPGALRLQLGGTAQINIASVAGVNTTTIYTPTVTFERGVVTPRISQGDLTTVSGTGQTLTIQAQNETGTTSTGGALVLTTGTGTTTAGILHLQTGGTDQITIVAGAAPNINITPSIVQWVTATVTPTLKQADTTGVGATMTVQAQNTTGVGGQAGGSLDLTSGSAASAALAGNVLIQTGGTTRITVAPAGITVGTTGQVNALVGSYTYTTRLVNASPFTIDSSSITDYILDVDTSSIVGGATITLPVPTNGRTIILRDITGSFGTNSCTLAQHSTEKINGLAASKVLSANWGSWTITSNGTDWFVM